MTFKKVLEGQIARESEKFVTAAVRENSNYDLRMVVAEDDVQFIGRNEQATCSVEVYAQGFQATVHVILNLEADGIHPVAICNNGKYVWFSMAASNKHYGIEQLVLPESDANHPRITA